jgi:GT2 family glycosyltransferase
MIRVSVVLIVKDESTIDQTLTQLYDQINTSETEVIVVDASEGRLSEITQKHPQVTWIDFQCRNARKIISIAEQRNAGVYASNGQVIVFCDAGGSPQPSWLDTITAPLLSGDQVLIGGPVRATNPSSLDSWTNLQQDGDEIQYPTTANLALTRSAFELVGGFNEDLDYGSDADLVWRLNAQGIKQICVAKAIMGLDGGSKKRELRRAWRYGKALADLLLLHPKKRLPKAKSNPEIWIYPVLTVIAFLSLPLFGFSKYLAFAFLTANLLLLIRNLKTKHTFQVLGRHYVYGWGFCYQLLRKKWPRFKLSEVLIYPSDDIRYLEELYKGFKLAEETDPTVAPFPKLTFSNTFNIFILPNE